MADLPLNGRNYIDLTLLQAGVSETKGPSNANVSYTGTYFVSNGATVRSNNYLLDGASLVNLWGASSASATGSTLGVDGIKEYKVITNSFSAEYGLTMGSQMTIVSKGGTNAFHGDVFRIHAQQCRSMPAIFLTSLSPRMVSGGCRNFSVTISEPRLEARS